MKRAGLCSVLMGFVLCITAHAVEMAGFATPSDEDRPWVYWFWKNGNISREGITADLEAMQRVGIGGVIMMEVALSVPPGEVTFFSDPWRELFKHAVGEAHRLGLKISINSGPGWTGSGGPWVKPDQSMKKVVASETAITGPVSFNDVLPMPTIVRDFYRDIAVYAFPSPEGDYRIESISEKALYRRGAISSQPGVRPAFLPSADYPELPANQIIAREKMVDLTSRMDAEGRLTWDAPEGAWTVMRIGYTSTGQTNRPAPLPGLECDKLNTEALDAHYRDFIAQLIADAGPLATGTIVATHLDSWEVGTQNWTERFDEAFKARRGYSPLPYLPVMTGRVVDSLAVSERFLWDMRQTVSEMIAEKHGRHLHDLAHQSGLWFSIEPYDSTPCDDMLLGAEADVPMCEFWSKGFDTRYSVTEAASIAHTYGRPIVAAEAFTSIDRWLLHPGNIKAMGDWAFSEGVNRFVIHRYIHQPFTNARPGLSLGPHGLHYERTATWWEYTKPWHTYLARCQYMLRQGTPVADVLYLNPEGAPNVFQAPKPAPAGFKFDACTPSLLMKAKASSEGITLPSGAQYRLLVMPRTEAMTPALLGKIRELVEAGAAVIGAPPQASPSLSEYPQCDAKVRDTAADLWGSDLHEAEGPNGRAVGQGRIFLSAKTGETSWPDQLPEKARAARWIWHAEDGDAASSAPPGKRYFRHALDIDPGASIAVAWAAFTADNTFALSVNGEEASQGGDFHRFALSNITDRLKPGTNTITITVSNGDVRPNPAGLIGAIAVVCSDGRVISFATDAGWESSITPPDKDGVWSAAKDLGPAGMMPWGQVELTAPVPNPYPVSRQVESVLATMRVLPDFHANIPLLYAHRHNGEEEMYFVANETAQPVVADCVFRVAGAMTPSCWHPETGTQRALPKYAKTEDGRIAIPLRFEAAESYFVVFTPQTGGATPAPEAVNFPEVQPVQTLSAPWTVAFDPGHGGPSDPVAFTQLEDWAQRSEPAIRYYSGPAVYRTTLTLTPDAATLRPLYLDLGRVEVMAAVKVNGQDAGIAWKAPYRVDITGKVQAGENALEITVVNLWPNRMIGDDLLPPDSIRNEDGVLKVWPQWLIDGKTSPTGRFTFATWRHWTKDSPLEPSGMLGPVTVLSEK